MSRRSSRLVLLAALAPLALISEAHAAPPTEAGGGIRPDSGTGGAGTGSAGGFVPPSGATFGSGTTADPGLLDRRSGATADQTYRATGTGHDIIDSSLYSDGSDGGVPDFHVVQEGDTLSEICQYYYGDMYLWPKLWSFNPHITNAHWIFPGDRVRLTDPYASEGSGGSGLGYAETYDPKDAIEDSYLLERYAFIDEDELDKSMEVVGGANAMVMMATSDTVYLGYSESNPPIPGERLSVYRKKKPVYDIKVKGKKQRHRQGKRIGWMVEVVGEVYVEKVAEKSAEATVVESVRPIERGQRVGELKTRFVRVQPTTNEVSANGLVVETIRNASITGERQFVIINLGAEDGIRRGNTLEIVQKGDAYTPDHRLHQPYDKGHPRRVLGRLLVLQLEGNSALTVMTESLQEVVVGDHVEITASGEEASDFEAYDSKRRPERSGSASAGDGSAEASGELRVGN